MTIDLNREPYFDDFDEEKGFYRILFRPGFAVQTRELNQLQTILQDQVRRFGEHIFREGSIVLGGSFDLQNEAPNIRITDVDFSGGLTLNDLIGKTIEGSNSGLRAFIVTATIDDPEEGTVVLFVRYLNSNELDETEFRTDEQVVFDDSGLTFDLDEENPIGSGTIFSIDDGVVFVRDFFVNFPKQTIVLDTDSNVPSLDVGFRVNEDIIDSIDDPSLLDNAQGTFNFAAPGANRLTLQLGLDKLPLGEHNSDSQFVLLLQVENGQQAESRERTQFARIYEEIAKRTFDESGDYYVNGMTVRTREALDTGENEGLDINGDPNKLSIDVEPGLAYVKGFEINNRVTKHILTDKGIDFERANNARLTARTGGFFTLNEIVGTTAIDEGSVIDLYDSKEERVTNSTNVSASIDGSNNKIGEARIKTVRYNSGDLGTPEGSLLLYLFDVRMNPGRSINETRSVNVENELFADVDGDLGFSDNIENTLIYDVGTSSTRKIRKDTDPENQTDTNYEFYTTISAGIASGSKTISVTSSTPLAYGLGVLSVLEKRSIFVTVDTALGSPNDLPQGAHLNIGDPSVTVTVTSPTSMTIDLGDEFESIGSNTPVTVTFKSRRQEVFETSKTLFPNAYVKINYGLLGSDPATLNGPVNLGLPDVFRVKEVRRKNDEDFVDADDGEDVTDFFTLDNGQRDNFYNHARLVPTRGFINENDFLLVKLDVFRAESHTYFSVDSYPVDDTEVTDTTIFTHEIPTYTSSSGQVFNLRDALDYRPYKQPTADYTIDVTAATINPTDTDDFVTNVTTGKLIIPVASSAVQFDYSFFLPRRDILTLDKEGNFGITRGSSSETAIAPTPSENVMPIASIFIPPFPSLSQTFGRILGRRDGVVTHERLANRRYTMRDIGVLRDRIDNLEYYNSLNLLEKETQDLQIRDELGLERFKNGFFAEAFFDHSLGATDNLDYNIAVDRNEQSIRPIFESDSFGYQLDESGQLEKTGPLVHVPIISEETLVDQPNATTTRNVEQSVYRFIGNLQLDPDNDTWVDESTVDKNVEFGDDLPTDKLVSTDWGSWKTNVIGANLYQRTWGDRSGDASKADFYGSFDSYADALKASKGAGKYGRDRTLIETIEEDRRSGIQTTVNFEKDTQELGNFVTDVSVIPYIRPQPIEFLAQGIRPRGRHFVFFDGEDVTEFVRQYEDVDEAESFTEEGSPLRANEFGQIRGVLFLPQSGKRFRTGTKSFLVIDNPNGNKDNTTSFAEENFVASGLDVQRQNTVLSTKVAKMGEQEEVFDTRNRRAVDTQVIGPSCLAYTFEVDVPSENEGVFVTSVDLFFAELNPDLGFRVQLRELNSGGNITQNVIPYSEVWVPRKVSDGQGGRIDNPIINITDDGSTPTRVEFEAPVFLYNETSYAVVISAENINPDTFVWISRLGQENVITQEPITSRRLTGALFTTNNGTNWDIVPQADLKFRLNRAKFQTGTNLTGSLINKPYEYLTLTDVVSTYDLFGEEITSSERLTVNIDTGGVSVGNTIEGVNTGAIAEVVGIDGLVVFTDGEGFEVGEQVEITSNGSTVGEGSISSINRGKGKIRKFKPETNKMIIEKSNGLFFEGARLTSSTTNIESTIDSIDSFKYSTTTVKPDFLDFDSTAIDFLQRGRLSASNVFNDFRAASVDSIVEFDNELHLLSHSTERNLPSSLKYSGETSITMNTNSEFLSPIVDVSRAHAVYVHNLINDDITEEDEPSGGNLINTYISKKITLSEDQDAEDLIVFLTSYLPPVENADVKVWMKVRNSQDPESFNEKTWVEMVGDFEEGQVSSLKNRDDFVELSFIPPESILDQNGIVTYDVDVDGTTVSLSTYRQFAIKIGILGTNSAIPPRVADLRAIALQK